jgi:aldehyde:ferredoxin oxidoreductase
LPARYYQPKQGGALADLKIDREAYEPAKKYYYVLMGWNEKGVPLPEKVQELGLE